MSDFYYDCIDKCNKLAEKKSGILTSALLMSVSVVTHMAGC